MLEKTTMDLDNQRKRNSGMLKTAKVKHKKKSGMELCESNYLNENGTKCENALKKIIKRNFALL